MSSYYICASIWDKSSNEAVLQHDNLLSTWNVYIEKYTTQKISIAFPVKMWFHHKYNNNNVHSLHNPKNMKQEWLKHRNTLGCLDQYMCKGLRLWNRTIKQSRYISTCMCRGWRLKHSGMWSSSGSHSYHVFTQVIWLCIFLVVKLGIMEFRLLTLNLTLKVKGNHSSKQ